MCYSEIPHFQTNNPQVLYFWASSMKIAKAIYFLAVQLYDPGCTKQYVAIIPLKNDLWRVIGGRKNHLCWDLILRYNLLFGQGINIAVSPFKLHRPCPLMPYVYLFAGGINSLPWKLYPWWLLASKLRPLYLDIFGSFQTITTIAHLPPLSSTPRRWHFLAEAQKQRRKRGSQQRCSW